MKKLSQKEIVKKKLRDEGVITNKWAIDNGMWRLGAIIKDLRDEGLEIETEYNTAKVGKNTHYYLKTLVKKVVYKIEGREDLIVKLF